MSKVLEQFYIENRDMLVKRVSFRAGGEYNAEDVVQEAFERALRYFDTFDPERKELGAWFNTILNNACKDFKRDEKSGGTFVEFDESYVEPYTPSETARDTERITREYIKQFPSPQSDALELYLLREYRPKEISEVLDAKIKTINTWTHKAKKELADIFNGVEECV